MTFTWTNAKQLVTETLTLDYFTGKTPAIPHVWRRRGIDFK